MRLIDADKAISELKELPEQEWLEYMGVYDLLKSQLTIDAEPVVRCKNCKYFIKYYNRPMCKYKDVLTAVKENHYCSAGAKMDEVVNNE